MPDLLPALAPVLRRAPNRAPCNRYQRSSCRLSAVSNVDPTRHGVASLAGAAVTGRYVVRGRDPLLAVLRQLTSRDRYLLELLYDHRVLTTEQIATAPSRTTSRMLGSLPLGAPPCRP